MSRPNHVGPTLKKGPVRVLAYVANSESFKLWVDKDGTGEEFHNDVAKKIGKPAGSFSILFGGKWVGTGSMNQFLKQKLPRFDVVWKAAGG
jgi:hypothetical protein